MINTSIKLEIPFSAPLEICKDCDRMNPQITRLHIDADDGEVQHTETFAYCDNESLCIYIARRLEEAKSNGCNDAEQN